jgi:hypothetical protein
MSTQQYEFRQRADGRYVIIDARTKNIIDTARGEGYRTRWGAQKAAWRMFATKNDGTAPAPWRGPEDVVRGVHTCFETGALPRETPLVATVPHQQMETGVEDARSPQDACRGTVLVMQMSLAGGTRVV